ncbi:hypothetical protein NIASO_00685 [Niabella soli DSM 19437]|uniref:Uncharacterized protein n=2 Tax=Niabella TaxID=379899 RepID=W0F6F6_9BACT|nr:hypothetical protein NIASO_00685 [Niabella soli DSM 19437]
MPSFAPIPPQKIQLLLNNGIWSATPNDTVIVNGSVTIGINRGTYQVSGDSVAFINTISLPVVPYSSGFVVLFNNKYALQQKGDSLFLSILSKNGVGEIYALKRQ